MNKPVIFFSHSSKDKVYLSALKNKILTKTANTIEVFQSSDGESIPFGNNWVHKIEENLKKAKLMFVFVSPNSLKSNWLYFESGFSYSNGVRVIPIGINGVDIGQLAPPINLLQGFNVTSHEGLNNLITIINSEFKSSFPTDFKLEDFNELFSLSNNVITQNKYLEYIDYVATDLSEKLMNFTLKPDPLLLIENFLKEKEIKHSKNGRDQIFLHGMVITENGKNFTIKIDQLKLEENLNVFIEILKLVYPEEVERYYLRINFLDNIDLLTTNFKLSSRLSLYGINMSGVNGKLYEYKNLLFALDHDENKITPKNLRIVFFPDNFDVNEIYELIEFLFEKKLIWSV